MTSDLDELLSSCRAADRICPMPQRWNQLYKLLPERRRDGVGWQPPLPLILAAWWETTDSEKQSRFEQHLRWAADHGALPEVIAYLHSLPETEWHHVGE